MPSKARIALEKNLEDIKRLVDLHTMVGGTGKGRRHGLEVLNKSAVVLLTSFWEAYCEDLAAEALNHLVKYSRSANVLPVELKKTLAKEIAAEKNDLAVWQLSDNGWRQYLSDRLERLQAERNRKLNTPKSQQIDLLFRETIGLEKVSDGWKISPRRGPDQARSALDEFVSLRGAIAHRGSHESSVKKKHVTDYAELIQILASKTGGRVNAFVRKSCGKPLFPARRKSSPSA